MDIGLVVLDTLRYDVFEQEFERTKDEVDFQFENLYSTSRWTVPAHASLFTGYYPTEVGTHSGNHHLTTEESTLAEQLAAEGYSTVGLSDNTYVDTFFNFDRGFEEFVRGPDLQGQPSDPSGFDWAGLFSELSPGVRKYPEALIEVVRSDAPTVETVATGIDLVLTSGSMGRSSSVEWLFEGLEEHLDEADDTFVFANLMTCHSPYLPPKEYRTVEPYPVDPFELMLREEPVTESEHHRHWESYRDCARYLDDQVSRLIEFTDWDALFVVSDHGELFGEHGLRQHQYGVYEELVHVPGVAVGDAVPEGRSRSLTSILDIYRTVLELADVEPNARSRGTNVFDGPDRERVYAESVGNYRYSPDSKGIDAKIPPSWGDPHRVYGEGSCRFFDDKDGQRAVDADTGRERPDRFDSMASEYEQFRRILTDVAGTDLDKTVPEEIESRLEHLGYR
jgi:arylsulfatase